MLRFLFTILLSLTLCFSFAQLSIRSEATDTIPAVVLTTEIKNNLDELGAYEIIDTLQKPFGYILEKEYQNYYLALKEKNKWVVIALETNGYFNLDSTKYVNVNNKGSKELLLFSTYQNGRYHSYGGFSEEYDEVYIYDLDAHKLLISFSVHSYYELSEITYYDSTGDSVDPYAVYRTIEQELSEQQVDSLTHANELYVATLTTESDQERYIGACSYKIEKNKLTLNCTYEEKQLGEDSSFDEYERIYVLKDDKWVLIKNNKQYE